MGSHDRDDRVGDEDAELEVSFETVHPFLTALGLWKPMIRKAARPFQARERRARFGELIQIDCSPHNWFERRCR